MTRDLYYRDKYRTEGKQHIQNGIIIVKFKYNIEDNGRITSLIGPNTIKNQQAIIQLQGHQQKCNICGTFGQIVKIKRQML